MSSQSTRQRQRKQQVEKHSRKPIEEIMRNLEVEPSVKLTNSNKVHSEDRSPSDAISSISSSAGDAKTNIKEINGDHDSPGSLPAYPMSVYYGYFYAGYDGTLGGSDDKGYYVPVDGTGLQYPVMQADTGSFIYFMPGIPPAYSSYSEYMPTNLISLDGQYAGQPPYSPSHVFQPSIPSSGNSPTPISYTQLVPSPHLWDPPSFTGDGGYGNVYSGILEIPGSIPSMSSPSHVHCHPAQKLPYDLNNPSQVKGFPPDVSSAHGVRHQSNRGSHNVSTLQPDLLGKGYFQYAKFPSYNQVNGGIVYPSIPGKPLVWGSTEKTRIRSKINGIGDNGMLNGHNHGPRTTKVKGALTYGGNLAGSLNTNGNGNRYSVAPVIRRDQYNLPEFPTKYEHALFFVIKSYSEDDIHKSIKYNVWASTPNGNKRLDGAYQDAQEKVAEKNSNCPVFLFFSVNASGQFCGVAEMISRVDFNKSMDFWQQDKWNGYFPVKWHIIKDVPNPQL